MRFPLTIFREIVAAGPVAPNCRKGILDNSGIILGNLVEGNEMIGFFRHYFGSGPRFIGYIVPFLFVLTIVVFFHELGHFLVGRWCGVGVLTFSIGFGPELFGFNDRHGTRWKISAIPLGGYVKFFGDENAREPCRDRDDR